MTKVKALLCAMTVVALGLVAAGCGPRQSDSAKDRAAIRLSVDVETVRRRTVERKKVFTGVLEALKKADLAPITPGQVRRIRVKVGDRVQRGRVLAEMDDAGLVAAIARFQPLKTQFERSQRLHANKAISDAQYEKTEAEYVALKRQVEQLQDNTTIKAPFSGVVTGVGAEDGELYRGSYLVQLAQLDPLKIDLDVDDRTVAMLRKGMEVAVVTDALPDTTFRGTVAWISPVADEVSSTFRVRVQLDNAEHTLKPGYFVEVAVIVESREDILAVPHEAVVSGRAFVVTDSVALEREVSTGWKGDRYREILSGLREGERVVVSGNKALPDSAVVIASDRDRKGPKPAEAEGR
jgi:membrane fusion protein (multidrug efflux system)